MYQGTRNLDVRVAPASTGYQAMSWAPEVGEAVEPFSLPWQSEELRSVVDVLAASSVDGRLSAAGGRGLEAVGERLFEALFTGEVYAAFRRMLDSAGRDGDRLRVRLRIAAPELVDLPWELLYFPARRAYLAVDRGTPLVRYMELPDPAPPLPIDLPLDILAVAAQPSDMPELAVAAERRKLERALGPMITSGDVRLRWAPDGTIDGLARALDAGDVHVVHYIGHGSWDDEGRMGILHFEAGAADRRAMPARADAVATAMRSHPSLRLVVLNACEGARAGPPFSGTSQALVKAGIPAVVAMQFAITDDAAVEFSGTLYRSLAEADSVDAAVVTARRAMYIRGHEVEWATPVLYLRSPDGRLFDRGRVTVPPGVAPKIDTIATGELLARNESVHGVRVDRAVTPPPVRRVPVRRAPADFPDLIGRDQEVAGLQAALSGDSFEIYGERGVGKSSLLRHVAHRLPGPHEDFVHLRVVGRPADDVAQRLFEEFYVETDPPLRPSAAQLRGHLAAIEALVILDDVELASDDLDDLLDTASSCRFLIASAVRSLTRPGRSRLLGGLDEAAAATLIARDLSRSLNAVETGAAASIARAVGGSPGRLLQAIAPVREGRASLAEIATTLTAGKPLFDDAAATRVRGLLSPLGAAPLSGEHIVALAGPGVDVAVLGARALIKANSPQYTLVTQAAPSRVAPIDPALYELLPHLAGWVERTRSDPARVVEDAEAIIAALRWGAAGERWGEVLRLARATEDALFVSRRWGQWRVVLDLSMAAASRLGDELEVARVRHQLGTRLLGLGDVDAARAELEQALELREALHDVEGAEVTRHNLGQIPPPPSTPDDEPDGHDWPGDGHGARGRDEPTPPPSTPWLAIAAGLAVFALLLVGVGIATGVIPPRPDEPAAPRLELDVTMLDFGELEVGQISGERSIAIRNAGDGAAGVLDIGLEPFLDDFPFRSDCPRELAPSEGCRVTVEFRPGAAGERLATLRINSAGIADPQLVTLRGVGVARPGDPAVEFRPGEIEFGEVGIGEPAAEQAVTLVGRGDRPLRVGAVEIANGPFTVLDNGCEGARLGVAQECAIRVAFEPDALGPSEGVLEIVTNAPGSPHAVPLAGIGTGEANLLVPGTLPFGDAAPEESVSQQLVVANDGTAPLTVTAVRIAPDPSVVPVPDVVTDFTVSVDGCSNVVIDRERSCTIDITFTPSDLGPRSAVLEIAHDAAEEPSTVLLTGRGYDGEPNLTGKAALANGVDYTDPDEDGFYEVDVVVSIANADAGTAGVFKIAARITSNQASAEVRLARRAGEPMTSDDPYLFTTRPLGGGALMEFEGVLFVPMAFASSGGTVEINLDSCVDEQVEDPRCRVAESNEDDNVMQVVIPSSVD